MLHWRRWDVNGMQNNGEGRILISNNIYIFLKIKNKIVEKEAGKKVTHLSTSYKKWRECCKKTFWTFGQNQPKPLIF